jgi:hypothetical protein
MTRARTTSNATGVRDLGGADTAGGVDGVGAVDAIEGMGVEMNSAGGRERIGTVVRTFEAEDAVGEGAGLLASA